jgi:hypothetical protein
VNFEVWVYAFGLFRISLFGFRILFTEREQVIQANLLARAEKVVQ